MINMNNRMNRIAMMNEPLLVWYFRLSITDLLSSLYWKMSIWSFVSELAEVMKKVERPRANAFVTTMNINEIKLELILPLSFAFTLNL